MAKYVGEKKKKKKKKSKMTKHLEPDIHVVIDITDLEKALTTGNEPANPGFRRDSFQGTTGISDGHVHQFSVQIHNGVVRGTTTVVNGHLHSIQANTGGQKFVSIPTNTGTPTVATQFEEAQGNAAGGRPTVEPRGAVHTHSIELIL